MKLEIGNIHIRDICFGNKTWYGNGILTVNKEEAIGVLNRDNALKNIDLKIARPGESIRILPVKAAVEPRYRPDGRCVFPGFTGAAVSSGEGMVYALKDMAVLAVGKHSLHGMNGLIDMSGPGADLSYFSKLVNLVIVAENADPEEDKVGLENMNFVKASCYLAEYLGTTLKDAEPEDWEQFELEDVSDRNLPRVAFINQLCNIPGWIKGVSYYGYDLTGVPTTVVRPLEYLDGALTGDSGALPGNAERTTYSYQNAPIIKRLIAEHGRTINFIGVILAGHIEPIDQKIQYATIVVSLAQSLRCDAVISMESHCGNVDVDYMMTLAGLEDAGIKTVGILAENNGRDGRNPGKTYTDAKADAIVSTGNTCEVYELPPMDTVYGNLDSIKSDPYWGAWKDDAVYGPSLREDGSLIVDAHLFMDHDGLLGWSDKTVKDF